MMSIDTTVVDLIVDEADRLAVIRGDADASNRAIDLYRMETRLAKLDSDRVIVHYARPVPDRGESDDWTYARCMRAIYAAHEYAMVDGYNDLGISHSDPGQHILDVTSDVWSVRQVPWSEMPAYTDECPLCWCGESRREAGLE